MYDLKWAKSAANFLKDIKFGGEEGRASTTAVFSLGPILAHGSRDILVKVSSSLTLDMEPGFGEQALGFSFFDHDEMNDDPGSTIDDLSIPFTEKTGMLFSRFSTSARQTFV